MTVKDKGLRPFNPVAGGTCVKERVKEKEKSDIDLGRELG